MKNLLLILFLMSGFGLNAQYKTAVDLNDTPEEKLIPTVSKMNGLLSHISVVASAGSSNLSVDQLKQANFRKIAKFSLSELSINFKTSSRFSFGIGTMGNISNCHPGYTNNEGVYVKLDRSASDDDNDNDNDNDTNEPNDNDTNGVDVDTPNDTDNDQDDDDHCGGDDDFNMNNLMGNVTFVLSNKFPLFIQAAGGYSFSERAPAYTALIGYNQRIFSQIGIRAGIRYSDVLYSLPADAVKGSLTSTDGLKAELGLSWNF